ncbi:MAG: DEAD/DEAH box helicase [Bacteriovoracaceae bacterium]
MADFSSFDLNPFILESLKSKGYNETTPIQAQAIPHLLLGKDLLGIAQTGTGKTAAFSLPILNRLANNKIKTRADRTRALILTPTRELASQINDSLRSYSKGLGIYSNVVFGGVGMGKQVQAMSRGVDILVATPGRLLDLMNHGHVRFDQLEVFVLDEADRMLDMGFIHDVKKIISKLPPVRQTMMFSATMSKEISNIAHTLLKEPVKVEVTPEATTVEKIDQRLMMVSKANKIRLLEFLLRDKAISSVLVFTKTKHGADRVVKSLVRTQVQASAIHGNKSQSARERALLDFRQGKIKVLVATDIAARGIDVPGVSHIINYDVPNDPESYVHRIGRTARAGREGIAITFCDEFEKDLLRAVEKVIRMKIPLDSDHVYHVEAPVTEFNASQPATPSGRPSSLSGNNRRRRR